MGNGSSSDAPASVDLLSVRVDVIRQDEIERHLVESVRARKGSLFAYLNVHAVNLAYSDPRLAGIFRAAHFAYCDGEGLRLGAGIIGDPLPPRLVLTTWIWDLCAIFEREGISIFLLGGTVPTVESAARNLKERYPALRVCGTHHGYFEKRNEENASVIAQINAARPDVLFVGFGMPLQEYWIEKNLASLDLGAVLPCGSMIEYVAGTRRVAPRWMANNGLEWLHRLLKEPRRLWKRYLIGNPLFMMRIAVQRLTRETRR